MAVKNNEYITMVDILSSAGAIPGQIVDITAQQNPMLTDAMAVECNMGAKHRTYVNKGKAQFVWGKAYQGVPTSKGRIEAIEHTTGYVESAIEVAKRTIDEIETFVQFAALPEGRAKSNALGMAKTKQFNLQAETHSSTISIGIAQALLYEDEKANPNRITGFFPYFNDKNAENGSQLILGSGKKSETKSTSILQVTWHESTNHLVYPKGAKSPGGLKIGKLMTLDRTDNDPNSDGRGGTYYVYRKDLEWHTGLAVNDWRYVTRIAGIDTTTLSKNLDANPLTGDNLIDLMTDAYYVHQGRRMSKGKTCNYANTTIVKYLDYQARNSQKNVDLFLENTGANAKEVLTFRKVPIKESDAFTNNESGFK